MPQKTTTCPLDCPDACKLLVTVDDGRVTKLAGAEDDPYTAGYICGKVKRYAEHVYSDERVRSPLRRTGRKGEARFEKISWDEALTDVTERISADCAKFGGESILPLCYGGSNGRLTQDAIDARFFYRLGASQLDRTVCAAPSGAAYGALYGKLPGVGIEQYPDCQLIIVWGNNPHASGIHFATQIQLAQKRGAKLVVIDPRRTPLAAKSDLHLPVYPGTDLVVALAMIRWLDAEGHVDHAFLENHSRGYDELRGCSAPWTLEKAAATARISQDALQRCCEWYATMAPAVIRCGWGPERNRNGGSATAAILALPAITNHFARGGGYTASNSSAWQFDKPSVIQEAPPPTRHINMNQVGEALLTLEGPPIRTLFVYNCNPVATLPDQNKVIQGMLRDDLTTVVFDQVMTDTARYADIVLPATTFLEHHDLRNGYGNTRLGNLKPVVDPVGESRPNYDVFRELVERLGLDRPDDVNSPDAMCHNLVTPETLTTLCECGESSADESLSTGAANGNPATYAWTSSGKIELFPDELVQASERGLYVYIPSNETDTYPLAFISPATGQTINSSLGYRQPQPARLTIHPDDANARGIRDGDLVRIFNDRGEVVTPTTIDAGIMPGVLSLPKGLWMRHTQNNRTANALAPDCLSDIGKGACFNDARVDVERWIPPTTHIGD